LRFTAWFKASAERRWRLVEQVTGFVDLYRVKGRTETEAEDRGQRTAARGQRAVRRLHCLRYLISARMVAVV
jgi:hypothetical protein